MKSPVPTAVVALACLGVVLPAHAAPSAREALERQLEITGAPSLSVAIARDGHILFAEAVGLADPGTGVAATPSTEYRAYSITKSMTALATLQLVEGGLVTLDDDVRKWVPEFPQKPWPILVRHLLTHTSGVRDYKKNAGEINSTQEYPTFADGIAIFKDDPLEFEPGTEYLYTSFGFNLLSGVVERAAGTSFEKRLTDSVWTPAAMTSTSLAVHGRDNPRLAVAHARSDDGEGPNRPWFGELPNLSAKYGSSGAVSTPTDLVRFVLAILDGKLLEPATRELMWTPAVPDLDPGQGLGWFVGELEGRRVIGRTGASAGYTGIVLYYPDEATVGALLTNVTPFKERTRVLIEVMKSFAAEVSTR